MRISADISRLQSGGGTNIYPGLKEAFEVLDGVNAKVKHVILLSDGEAPYDGIVELVQDMRSARITVSAVGVPGADRNLLSMIADNGDGRLYMTDDIGALPRIFMKETTEAQKSQLVEDAIRSASPSGSRPSRASRSRARRRCTATSRPSPSRPPR
jgi:Ca-activated chloride channel family protein